MNTPPPPGLPDVETPPKDPDTRTTRAILLSVEGMLKTLVESLAQEDEEEERPSKNLDGVVQGGPRDQTRSLG